MLNKIKERRDTMEIKEGKKKGKLKLVVIALVAIGVIGAAAGAGGSGGKDKNPGSNENGGDGGMVAQSPSDDKNDPLSDDIIDVDISNCNVKYIKHEIVENMSGDKCVAVYYEFTNNSKDNRSFYTTVSDKAFQNGIELEDSLFHVNDESKNSTVEIKPGVTLTVCSGFVLRDEESDVELEISAWISFKDNPDDKMVLSIK